MKEEQPVVREEPPKKKEPERRVINLPEEPGEKEAEATRIVFRMPMSGERI